MHSVPSGPVKFSSELIIVADPDPSRKTQRSISFKMSVLRTSETPWVWRYDLFCVFNFEERCRYNKVREIDLYIHGFDLHIHAFDGNLV